MIWSECQQLDGAGSPTLSPGRVRYRSSIDCDFETAQHPHAQSPNRVAVSRLVVEGARRLRCQRPSTLSYATPGSVGLHEAEPPARLP